MDGRQQTIINLGKAACGVWTQGTEARSTLFTFEMYVIMACTKTNPLSKYELSSNSRRFWMFQFYFIFVALSR